MTRRGQVRDALYAGTLCVLAWSCAAQRPAPVVPPPTAAAVAEPPVAGAAEPEPSRARQRNVALIGDSTTYGTPPPRQGLQSPYDPGATLEALLATLEPLPAQGGTPWRDARVHNLAVGASDTTHWLADPPRECHTVFARYPVVAKACAEKVSWVEAVPMSVAGGKLDAVIVDLGINDVLITSNPAETVDRLERIRSALAPVPVLFFPPIAPPDGPRGDWPKRVRAEMTKRGLFAEAQYPPYLPTFDGLHPTTGGYAAMGALWLDGLRKLP